MDLATEITAIVESASGLREFWDGLDHLPPVARYGHKPDERASIWANASLGDYVIVAEYLRTALSRVVKQLDKPEEQHVPEDIQGHDREFLVHCRYSVRFSVPCLIAARKVIEASKQTSLLIYQLYIFHQGIGTQSGVEELERLRPQLGWAGPAMLEYMLSPAEGSQKLKLLKKAVNSLTVTASWMYAHIAVEHWPPSLNEAEAAHGEQAMRMLDTIVLATQAVMTNPEYLALTGDHIWERLGTIANATGKSYCSAIRQKIKAARAPCGSRPVAVLDPTSALYAAAIGVIGPALKGMRSGKDDGSVDRAIQTYIRVRAGFRPPEMDRTAPHDQYTDFVIPAEGDGLWPASVGEVEYLVRDLLMLRGMDGEALNTPLEMIAEVGGGWIYLRTPWSLPIGLLDTDNVEDWHRRAPLLAWMIHASTNPAPEQNFCANHDTVVRAVRTAWASEVQRKRYEEFWADVLSVAVPPALATGFLFTFFPNIPPEERAPIAAMILPMITLIIQKVRNRDKDGAK